MSIGEILLPDALFTTLLMGSMWGVVASPRLGFFTIWFCLGVWAVLSHPGALS